MIGYVSKLKFGTHDFLVWSPELMAPRSKKDSLTFFLFGWATNLIVSVAFLLRANTIASFF